MSGLVAAVRSAIVDNLFGTTAEPDNGTARSDGNDLPQDSQQFGGSSGRSSAYGLRSLPAVAYDHMEAPHHRGHHHAQHPHPHQSPANEAAPDEDQNPASTAGIQQHQHSSLTAIRDNHDADADADAATGWTQTSSEAVVDDDDDGYGDDGISHQEEDDLVLNSANQSKPSHIENDRDDKFKRAGNADETTVNASNDNEDEDDDDEASSDRSMHDDGAGVSASTQQLSEKRVPRKQRNSHSLPTRRTADRTTLLQQEPSPVPSVNASANNRHAADSASLARGGKFETVQYQQQQLQHVSVETLRGSMVDIRQMAGYKSRGKKRPAFFTPPAARQTHFDSSTVQVVHSDNVRISQRSRALASLHHRAPPRSLPASPLALQSADSDPLFRRHVRALRAIERQIRSEYTYSNVSAPNDQPLIDSLVDSVWGLWDKFLAA
ncbi:hypothetical protein CAOG_00565 [Capsaspora owczarzaki ATCC 30864]|uniref:Uncharacterized protein n=1 Tax=Capsaspora owczarzaki (strain ATCC 30864) TaxID=595528 RepID=A0A0D2WIR2_CAPO3|nr:hypothetical protein CAOG_00565 [Capsaspora owczarzaki ATCC 30864]KJE89003.1 hypothetical protein CAOG_000565 [Capsaspora owczarzaki ATCC 30864]|eukprot:XP_004365436.1 hypothetical protein CAOG_00565 [Capsaspora owczarzaki ATCC 30864]